MKATQDFQIIQAFKAIVYSHKVSNEQLYYTLSYVDDLFEFTTNYNQINKVALFKDLIWRVERDIDDLSQVSVADLEHEYSLCFEEDMCNRDCSQVVLAPFGLEYRWQEFNKKLADKTSEYWLK